MMSKKEEVAGGREKQQMCHRDVWPKLLSDAETEQGKKVTG